MDPTKKLLSFDDIKKADDRKITPFEAPEWGGWVHCRVMTSPDRDAYDRESATLRERAGGSDKYAAMENWRARLTRRTLCDAEGNLLVKTPADFAALCERSQVVLDRFADLALDLNEMTAEAVKRRAGKSEAPTSGEPGSGSPAGSAAPSTTSSPS